MVERIQTDQDQSHRRHPAARPSRTKRFASCPPCRRRRPSRLRSPASRSYGRGTPRCPRPPSSPSTPPPGGALPNLLRITSGRIIIVFSSSFKDGRRYSRRG